MSDTKRPAVFVDRDNTLIHDPGYLRHADHVRLLPGVGEAVGQLRQAGFPVVVVTNQSGVARGYLTEDELASVHQRMQELLQGTGSGVDAIYYCPYLTGPDAVVEEYRKDSDLRKPRPGMLQRAATDMNLDLAASWMIGDSERDIQAGKAVGCKTVFIGNGNLETETLPDFTAASFAKAAEIVLKETKRRTQPAAPKNPPAPASPRKEALEKPASDAPKQEVAEKPPAARPPAPAPSPAVSESSAAAVAVMSTANVAATQARVLEPRPASAPSPAPVEALPARVVAKSPPEAPASRNEKSAPNPSPTESATERDEKRGGKITGEPLPNAVVQPPKRDSESGRKKDDAKDDKSFAASSDAPDSPRADVSLNDVVEEIRMLKRDQRFKEFSFAQLAGAVAQAFAICALGFGAHAMMNNDANSATLRLLLAIVLQLMALTGFMLTRR